MIQAKQDPYIIELETFRNNEYVCNAITPIHGERERERIEFGLIVFQPLGHIDKGTGGCGHDSRYAYVSIRFSKYIIILGMDKPQQFLKFFLSVFSFDCIHIR